MIERKLRESGIKKVIPADDLLGEAYVAFHHGTQLRDVFEEAQEQHESEACSVVVPVDLRERVSKVLDRCDDLRWDDAVQIVLDETQLDHVRAKKRKAKKTSGDFTDNPEDNGE